MANSQFNNNPFFQLTSNVDDWGIGTPGDNGQQLGMSFGDNSVLFEPQPNTAICLDVANSTGDTGLMNAYIINFNVYPDFNTPNSSPIQISFVNVVSTDDISNLIHQLDFTKFSRYGSTSDLNSDVNLLLIDVQNLLNQFPQIQLAKSGYITSQVNQFNSTIANAQSQILAFPTPPNPSQQAQEDKLGDQIDAAKASLAFINTFVDSNGTSLAADVQNKIDLRYNSFQTNFTSIIDQVYNQAVTNGTVTPASGRTVNSTAVTTTTIPATTTASGPGLSIDQQAADATAATNQVLAQNQIIPLVGISGTNLFGPHQPFDQTLSILDVLRNENGGVSFTADTTVKNPIANTNSGVLPTACQKILNYFSQSELQAMVDAMNVRAGLNTTAVTNVFITLKRLTSTPQNTLIGALTGFVGLDFSKINLADPSTIDFSGPLNQINQAITYIQSLTLASIGGPFGLMIIKATQAISNQEAIIYAAVFKAMNSVNFSIVFNQLDPSLLQQCLSIANIKNWMQNPHSVVSTDFNKAKTILIQSLKLYRNQILNAQAIVQEIVAIKSEIANVEQVIKNPQAQIQVSTPLATITTNFKAKLPGT